MHFYCHSFHSPGGGMSAQRGTLGSLGLFASPAQDEEQHPAAAGGAGCSIGHPCTGEGYGTLPTSLPLFPLRCLKGISFLHKENSKKKKPKKICFRKTLDHIKIQVALSELENQVLYISL